MASKGNESNSSRRLEQQIQTSTDKETASTVQKVNKCPNSFFVFIFISDTCSVWVCVCTSCFMLHFKPAKSHIFINPSIFSTEYWEEFSSHFLEGHYVSSILKVSLERKERGYLPDFIFVEKQTGEHRSHKKYQM